jgi:hypothetical protein
MKANGNRYRLERVQVSIDGRGIAWSTAKVGTSGRFGGTKALCDRARRAAVLGEVVIIRGVLVQAGDQDALSATAAMFAADPGRARLISAPGAVYDALPSLERTRG